MRFHGVMVIDRRFILLPHDELGVIDHSGGVAAFACRSNPAGHHRLIGIIKTLPDCGHRRAGVVRDTDRPGRRVGGEECVGHDQCDRLPGKVDDRSRMSWVNDAEVSVAVCGYETRSAYPGMAAARLPSTERTVPDATADGTSTA